MKLNQVFPAALIVMQVLASAEYWVHHDWRHALYWLFAAGITAVVTF